MKFNNFKQTLIGIGVIIIIFLALVIILVRTFPSMTPKFRSFGESPIVNQRIINLEKSNK